MTKLDAKRKLEEAASLIFEVEKQFIEGEFPRLHGYRARIALGTFQDNIGFTYWTKDENLTNQKPVLP
jgi:hypothetical protein